MKTFSPRCAAIDLGAASGRVILGEWDGSRLETREVHRFPNQFRSLGERLYWDIPYLWEETRRGLDMCGELDSIGVDSWAVDYVLVDESGRPVTPTHAYRDSRTQPLSDRLAKEGFERIYELTGIPNYPYNTSLQLQETVSTWPHLEGTVKQCLFIADYFNFLLSGTMANELSMTSHSQLLDVNGRNWSAEAMQFFGVPSHWLGKPTMSPAILGPAMGYGKAQTVMTMTHDTASAFAAIPAGPNDFLLSTGTWSLGGFIGDKPILGDRAREAKISNERMGDGRYRPLRSCLGLWLLDQTLIDLSATPRDDAGWQALLSAAKACEVPGELIDTGDSRFFNPASMKETIDGSLTKPPANPPEYMRLICDSLGEGHAQAVRLFEELSERQFEKIMVVGGGAKNPLLCQATANATGKRVVSYELEGAALGNIGAQLVAMGAMKTMDDFRSYLGSTLTATTYEPGGKP